MSIATSPADALLLIGAGILAGVVGTAGGITSVISYPALLAVGVPVLPANATNLVALVACWPGSALSSRPELAGRGPWLARWALIAAAGGAMGAALLVLTPAGVFGQVVPFLLILAAVSLLLQPRVSAWRAGRLQGERDRRLLLPAGLLTVSLYNGYFGAGAGVMVLVLLLIVIDQRIATANALKNMLVGAATVASAATVALFGSVDWTAAAPLAVGMFVGSTVGPRVARRLPSTVLRWLVAATAVGLAIGLWV